MRESTIFAGLFLFAGLALAQNESVFRTTTQLVRIDVAAQDKNGNSVTDLTINDFELKVSGKPQRIDTFAVASSEIPPAEILPRGTFSNKQAAAEVSHGRYTAFLLDWRNTNWALQSWGQSATPQNALRDAAGRQGRIIRSHR
jgi:hypothetical protein